MGGGWKKGDTASKFDTEDGGNMIFFFSFLYKEKQDKKKINPFDWAI